MSKKQKFDAIVANSEIEENVFDLANKAFKLHIGVKAVEKTRMIGAIVIKDRIEF